MRPQLHKVIERVRLPYQEIWPTTIFVALLLTFLFGFSSTYELTHFDNHQLGESALRNYDVSSRIRNYYVGMLIFMFSILLLTWLYNELRSKLSTQYVRIVNICSILGLFMMTFYLFSGNILSVVRTTSSITELFQLYPSIGLIIMMLCFLTIIEFIFNVYLLKKLRFAAEGTELIILLMISINFSILLLGFLNILGFWPNYLFILILTIFVILLLYSLLKSNVIFQFDEAGFYNGLKALMFFPLILILKDEFYLILESHEIKIFTPNNFFLILTAIAFLCGYFLWKKEAHKIMDFSNLKSFYYPVFIANIILLIGYRHEVIAPTDMFEIGNPALALQQFYDYGKWPIFESFNSHLLSEIFFAFIYTTINGYSGLEYSLYNFLGKAFTTYLAFLVIKQMTSSDTFSLGYIVLIPFAFITIPLEFCFAFITLFAFNKLYTKTTLLNFIYFFLSILGMILWRIDIGFSNLFAGLGILGILLITKIQKGIILKMTKAFGLSFGPPLIIFLFLCWLKNTNPINLTLTILSHFSASQSYGYKAISLEYDMTFFAHYIIFPILVLLFAGYLFFRIFQNKNKENDTDALNSYLLLYCCFFYILNFHRGLVRHSFVEESDLHLSTFFFLIFPSGILILCKPYLKKEYLQIAFVLISIILLYNYKNPKSEVLNSVSVLDQFTQRLNSYQPISSTEIEINRGTNKQKNQYKNILHFFKTNLSKNQTFFDFTNSPMLYFYARKENPVYFNQSPNMIHNDFLQEMTLKSLSKQDIPFVLYRHIPEHGHDAFEEIPNAVRHYLLSHHIFEKYEPYLIIDGFAVWKSKDLVTEDLILDKHYKVDQISGQPIMQDIGMIPYVWAKFDIEKLLPIIEKSKDTDILDANIGHSATFQFGSSNNKKLGNSVLVKITSQKDETHDIKLTYGKGEKIHGRFMFKTYNDHLGHYYLIRMSTQYNWLNKNNNYVEVQPLSGNVKIQFIGIL